MLQTEVAFGVIEADAFNDFLQAGFDIGILTVFYPRADKITHNPAEIVMPGVAEEGTGVGEHADKVA